MLKIFSIFLLMVVAISSNALACIKQGERISGMNKVCYYSCPSGEAAITVASYELCPLYINDPQFDF